MSTKWSVGRALIFRVVVVLAMCLPMAASFQPAAAAPLAYGVGTCAQVVNANSAGGLAVRNNPSTSATILRRLSDGTQVTITDGPRSANGYTWWKHNQGGWSAGSYLANCTQPVTYSITSDLRDRTSVDRLTGADVDNALRAMRSSNNGLIGYGQTFVDVGRRLGINPLYIAAHAAWETGWGTSAIWVNKNNPFGYGAFDRCAYSCALTFRSKADGISTGMDKIKLDYLVSNGRFFHGYTLAGMNVHYATDQNWKNGIASIMTTLAQKLSLRR